MYVIRDNQVILVDTKEVLSFGAVQDPRICKIEAIVADYFDTTVHELNVFYKDTEAKILCCFMLHDLFTYSIGSLAVRYNIDRLFLRNKITQIYINCLQDEADMRRVIALRSAFFCSKKENPDAVAFH